MASCGCNGHTGDTGYKADNPDDWVTQIFGANSDDTIFYGDLDPYSPKQSDIIEDTDYEFVMDMVSTERTRRALNPVTGTGTSTDPFQPAVYFTPTAMVDYFNAGEIIEASDYNSLIDGLNEYYNSGISTITISHLIVASEVTSLIENIKSAGTQCVCNCNYCTCNCNACLCNCNYSCTCNCNYNWSDETLKTNIEYL